jgi:hypothetical protein
VGFITVEYLKALPLPISNAQWAKVTDAQIQIKIDEATQYVKDYLDREIELKTFTERLRGSGRSTLMLNERPLVSLVSIVARDMSENAYGSNISDFLIDAGAGIIEFMDRNRYNFSNRMMWVVTYTAGYAVVPGPLKAATALQVVEMLQPLFRQSSTGMPAEFMSETSEQFVDLTEKYRRKRIS